MNWKITGRAILRGALVVLCLGALAGMAAFLPGSVEGNYNNFVTTCMCDGRNVLNVRANHMVGYHSNHQPAEMLGSYVTRRDGVVEFHLPPSLAADDGQPFMKAYPYLLVTKFVHVADGEVRWQWKMPPFGIDNMIRDQEICEEVPGRKGVQKRKIYNGDFEVIRHEKKELKNPWKQVPEDEVPIRIFPARRIDMDIAAERKDAADAMAFLIPLTPPSEDWPLTARRAYRPGDMLMEAEVSRARFDSVFQEALLVDSSGDSLRRACVELIVMVDGFCYLIEYENGEANDGESGDDRFRIMPQTPRPLLRSEARPFGTSHDREILTLLRKATATMR